MTLIYNFACIHCRLSNDSNFHAALAGEELTKVAHVFKQSSIY